MITLKELKDELQSQCVIMDRKFDMYDGKIEGIKSAINEKFDTLENNHLAHIRTDISEICDRMTKFETNQKWAFLIGGFLMTVFFGSVTFLLKHLFTLLT